jgi:beta-lactam-binding protein with PASTA domain
MTQCEVPGVVGVQLDTARTQIVDAGCSVGKITRVRSQQVGIVLAQNPAAGATLPPGGRVDLTVGRR